MWQIDEIDKTILKALITNARTKLKNIAEDCNVSITAIKRRIDNLEKKQLIIKPALLINMEYFGYPITATIGINMDQIREETVIEIVQTHSKVAGINKTIGNYDLCLFVYAKTLNDVDTLKQKIRAQSGVKTIDVNIWHKLHIKYDNINI